MDKIARTFTPDQEFACWSSSSSSESIGMNSDVDDENEVESSYKGPLDMMESLEEVLVGFIFRRGISKFYQGKSKSFTSLKETASLPLKDLTKQENLYSRRRRNLLSHRICSRGGISKIHVKSVLTVSRQREGDSSSSSGDDDSTPTLRLYRKNLTPRQRSNCVPVVDSPRCFQTTAGGNIPNIIC
ncbi:PREDICTED: uncharacterized protein LOC109133407 [Camelina sativa]|uniref:Uncharacterized protein LOC109133407 n=1 Tax=Camelina sativa TaxID=90675 RepID=A0ABM1RSQ2_CAMSA|nr:PREDICTED: uncharacterized protein LOC109133407 [Camelina sativa]